MLSHQKQIGAVFVLVFLLTASSLLAASKNKGIACEEAAEEALSKPKLSEGQQKGLRELDLHWANEVKINQALYLKLLQTHMILSFYVAATPGNREALAGRLKKTKGAIFERVHDGAYHYLEVWRVTTNPANAKTLLTESLTQRGFANIPTVEELDQVPKALIRPPSELFPLAFAKLQRNLSRSLKNHFQGLRLEFGVWRSGDPMARLPILWIKLKHLDEKSIHTSQRIIDQVRSELEVTDVSLPIEIE